MDAPKPAKVPLPPRRQVLSAVKPQAKLDDLPKLISGGKEPLPASSSAFLPAAR
jgi:hypothetical protein